MRSAARHFPAFLLFTLLAIVFSWPLSAHLGDGVLGAGAGDNMSALWNIWWARTAIRGSDALFWTPALFAPLGTGLVLHSFAPLASVAAALITAADPPTAYNLALIVTIFLNLSCAYWAAWTVTRDPLASCFAAVAFGGAPCLLVRLQGHLNVLSAWGLPLLLVAVRRFGRVPGATSSVLLGGALALLAYTDAYYAIFGVALLIASFALSRWPLRPGVRGQTPNSRRRVLGTMAVLILALCGIVAWIEATGGTDTTLAGVRLRMTDSFNPRVILGFLLVAAWLTWKWPLLTIDRPAAGPVPPWRQLVAVGIVAALLASPLLVAGLQLWRVGDYESQTYFWRSAPPGIDLAALALGNPIGVLNGRWTAALYDRLSIDRVESAAWIGIAPLLLLAWGIGRLRSPIEARTYLWIAGLFFVWSLGPYLRVFGLNTAMMLPQTILRFVPVVANARIPGRAFVVVQLMIAVLGAMVLASLSDAPRRRRIALLAIAAVVLDFWPAPQSWTMLDRPALYDTLKTEPPGIVLEIPLGLRDGFGVRGALDHRVLFYQTIHGHPQMGGFVARLSSRIKTTYDADPIIGPILDLSEGRTPAPRSPSAPCLLTCDVRYVVIDEAEASDELEAFVAKTFSLRLLARNRPRALYAVD